MALVHTPDPELGAKCPDFNLPSVDGKNYSLKNFDGTNVLVVMFICNHCPYVKAIEDRLIELNVKIKELGGQVVGICSNDANDYPEDSFENLKARWEEKNYRFPYLFDESQEVAKSFGAVCTPDYFVYDASLKLQYRGRLDDNWQEPENVTKEELFEAAKAIVDGADVGEQIASMGCSIKWSKA